MTSSTHNISFYVNVGSGLLRTKSTSFLRRDGLQKSAKLWMALSCRIQFLLSTVEVSESREISRLIPTIRFAPFLNSSQLHWTWRNGVLSIYRLSGKDGSTQSIWMTSCGWMKIVATTSSFVSKRPKLRYLCQLISNCAYPKNCLDKSKKAKQNLIHDILHGIRFERQRRKSKKLSHSGWQIDQTISAVKKLCKSIAFL